MQSRPLDDSQGLLPRPPHGALSCLLQSNSSQDVARLTGQVEKLQVELTASAERLTVRHTRGMK